MEAKLIGRSIVRHYRAATRAEVEQAYRADAGRAAAARYSPISHNWVQNSQGFLLAVTYRTPAGDEPVGRNGLARDEAPQAAEERTVTIAQSSAPTDEFEASTSDPGAEQFAPPELEPEPELESEPGLEPEPELAVEPELEPAFIADDTTDSQREDRLTIQTMDLHTAGEPLRLIRSGFPEVPNLPV
ncbi:MAG TPA: hypothetical protein VEX62_07940, partial [Candidatus Limnocylindrales bacterium]|nr:hypothetical protein [Candidatus Limnocylindrales bacterium]